MNPSEQPLRNQHPLANYQFTSEELRVLRECNTESFFQRSLPLGTGFGVGIYFGIKNGILKPNVKYGMVPKIVLGVVLGYFLGKFSYQEKCAEKLMRLPNSQIGEVLRQRKQGGVMGRFAAEQNLGVGLALAPFQPNADIYSDDSLSRNPNSALNLDTDRPNVTELDDIYRPSLDSSAALLNEPEIPVEPVSPGTSYEELRKLNRDEYTKRQQSPYSRPLPESAPVVLRQNPQQAQDDKRKGQTNKYGDTWTE